MQVGNALIGVHHVKRGALGHDRIDRGQNFSALWQAVDLVQQSTKALIGADARCGQCRAICIEDRLQKHFDRMTKDDRVGHLHHRGLQVDRKQNARILGRRDLLRQKRIQRLGRHARRINNRTGCIRHFVFQHRDAAICTDQFDPRVTGLFSAQRDRFFI